MATEQEIRIPDIGDFEDVEVIEVLVAAGDSVEREDSLVTIESDKASMEIPSPFGGVIAEVAVSVGDRVSEGALLARITPSDTQPEAEPPAVPRESVNREADDKPATDESSATSDEPDAGAMRAARQAAFTPFQSAFLRSCFQMPCGSVGSSSRRAFAMAS